MTYIEVVGKEVSIGGSAYVFSRQVFMRERYFCSRHIFKNSNELVVHFWLVYEKLQRNLVKATTPTVMNVF